MESTTLAIPNIIKLIWKFSPSAEDIEIWKSNRVLCGQNKHWTKPNKTWSDFQISNLNISVSWQLISLKLVVECSIFSIWQIHSCTLSFNLDKQFSYHWKGLLGGICVLKVFEVEKLRNLKESCFAYKSNFVECFLVSLCLGGRYDIISCFHQIVLC